MNKFALFFNAFQKGQMLSNSAVWKDYTIASNAVLAFLAAMLPLLSSFGVVLDLEPGTLESMTGILVTLITVGNGIMTVVTSDKVGIETK
jgi:hypothetical protein